MLLEQIKTVETERDALLAAQQVAAPAPAAMLLDFKGIGPEFAAALWLEGLFRHFDNRRQIASYAGLAPTPWQSGSVDREQGVSKAGNPRLRTTLIQLAWLWLRHQPQSAHIRELLAVPLIPIDDIKALNPKPEEPKAPEQPCPCCGGHMRIIETFRRGQQPMHRATPVAPIIRIDTS